jgi:hypothetical protein
VLKVLLERLPGVLRSIAPLIGVVCVLQVTVVQAPLGLFLQFVAGSVLVVAGMLLLLVGVDLGILPMGRFIGAELPRKGSLWLIAAVAGALGFATTAAEPDVLILANQVQEAAQGALSAQALVYVISAGVGLLAAVALVRVIHGFSMRILIATGFGLMLVLSLFAPESFVPMAYDAGGVTTGLLSAPVLLALSLGLVSVLSSRSAGADGFGVLGLASMGAVIAVLLMGLLQ